MIILFFIIAVVVSLPVAAIVLVSVASKREDRRFSLGGQADGRVQETARRILDFHTESRSDWMPASDTEPSSPARQARQARPRKRIDSPLQATRMMSFRHAA